MVRVTVRVFRSVLGLLCMSPRGEELVGEHLLTSNDEVKEKVGGTY